MAEGSPPAAGNLKRGVAALPALLLSHLPAAAHGGGADGPHEFWFASWSIDPIIVLPLLFCCCLYLRGGWRLRRRAGRFPSGFGGREIALFMSGAGCLAAALLSPLEALADILLSAHMVQHILLVAVAPPLLVLGKPEVAWLQGLPDRWRRGLPRHRPARTVLRLLSPFSKPIPATLLHMATLWAWHSPALFDAALASGWLHWLEHLTFFGTALLFWRAVIRAGTGRRNAAGASIACFITLLQSGLLSALLSFAREPLYRSAGLPAWGLTALEDQQLAGAIMSLPMCLIYVAAGLATAYRLLLPASLERRHPCGVSSLEPMKQKS